MLGFDLRHVGINQPDAERPPAPPESLKVCSVLPARTAAARILPGKWWK